MAEIETHASLDPSTALAVLDRILDEAATGPPASASSAWDAAWIACLTNNQAWAETALTEFRRVAVEMRLSDNRLPRHDLNRRRAA